MLGGCFHLLPEKVTAGEEEEEKDREEREGKEEGEEEEGKADMKVLTAGS